MLTVKGIGNAPGYRNYLALEAVGQWVGEGSKMLGLAGPVSAEDYRSIRLGLDPETGAKLRRNTPVDRTYNLRRRDGTEYQKVYHAAQIYDLTVGAPKTISILAIEDTRAIEAHKHAVDSTVHEMEGLCGPMAIARYDHSTSRTLDPHLHTHLAAGNLSWTGEKWQTLHASRLIRAQELITDTYRHSLLNELADFGYGIKWPDVEGISPELVQKFSQRSLKRDELIEQFSAENKGLVRASRKEVGNFLKDNRPAKLKPIVEADFWDSTREKLTAPERISLRETVDRAYEHRHRLKIRLDVGDGADSGPQQKPWSYGVRVGM